MIEAPPGSILDRILAVDMAVPTESDIREHRDNFAYYANPEHRKTIFLREFNPDEVN